MQMPMMPSMQERETIGQKQALQLGKKEGIRMLNAINPFTTSFLFTGKKPISMSDYDIMFKGLHLIWYPMMILG